MTRNRLTLRHLATALGLTTKTADTKAAEVHRPLDEAPEAEPPADGPADGPGSASGSAPQRARIVALLVPESTAGTEPMYRLRAAPEPDTLPDHVPDGAGSIYRTHDGRIVLDWHQAS